VDLTTACECDAASCILIEDQSRGRSDCGGLEHTNEVSDPVAGGAWRPEEIDVIVAAYMSVLAAELAGTRVNKASRIRDLTVVLTSRTAASIERKMQNISAVLDELQLEWIDGYKPLSHYQRSLRTAVEAALTTNRRISETLAEYRSNVLPAPMPTQLATTDVLVDTPSIARRSSPSEIAITTGPLGALRDFQNRRLSRAGEEWVLGIEREYLARASRHHLADQVRWVSDDVGDGAGYDIDSFRLDGLPVHVEVKTTNLGRQTPFYVTRWEVAVSDRAPESYALYRVFDFRSDPRLYRLEGSIERSARLEPTVFVGLPR
jgi:hypothetical protein